MAVTVQCTCGKRVGVSDALMGKTIRCPKCGEPIAVKAAPSAPQAAAKPGKASAATKTKSPVTPKYAKSESAALAVDTGLLVKIGFVLMVVTFILITYFGPVRVWHQWEDVGPKASGEITDVVDFALKAYLSTHHYYNPRKGSAPSVNGDVGFFRPVLVMSMPEKVKFFGSSSQGKFTGYYDTKTGDIDADIDYGGITFAGMVSLAKSTGTFHVTGRDPNGNPEAECDGEKMSIYYPPKEEDDN